MSSYSAFRLFFRLEKVGRIQFYGGTGLNYVNPILERQRFLINEGEENRKNHFGIKTALLPNGKLLAGPHRRYYSTSVTVKEVMKADSERGEPKKKPKTLESPKIKLISETQSLTVVTLEEAKKIAEKKSLHLISVDNKSSKVKTEKPTYRLLTHSEFLAWEKNSQNDNSGVESESESDEKKKHKEPKTVLLKSKIAENDALSKVKQMAKWIEKGHPVRVMIGQSGDTGNAESIYKLIEENLKDSGARFLQKITKGNQIRFQLMPPKELPSLKIKGESAEK